MFSVRDLLNTNLKIKMLSELDTCVIEKYMRLLMYYRVPDQRAMIHKPIKAELTWCQELERGEFIIK